MPIFLGLDCRILIADDLPSMRADLVRILTEMGYTNIKQVIDGKAAWDELRTEAQFGKPYDMIFSDINMPQMNGLVLLKNLRGTESYKHTPIFMVSTENEKGTIIKAIMDGASDYIIKPYDPILVQEKVVNKLTKMANS